MHTFIVAPTTAPTSVPTDETTLTTPQENTTAVANANGNDTDDKSVANANSNDTDDKGELIQPFITPVWEGSIILGQNCHKFVYYHNWEFGLRVKGILVC